MFLLRHRLPKFYFVLVTLALTISCSGPPKPSEIAELEKNEEFEQVIQVKKFEQTSQLEQKPQVSSPVKAEDGKMKKGFEAEKKKSSESPKGSSDIVENDLAKGPEKTMVEAEITPPQAPKVPRMPELEDYEGFYGRRPKVDPFTIGEVLTYDVSYGLISAGTVRLKVRPFLEVNGKKSYNFSAHVDSNSVFSLFYKVNDWAETYVDYNTLLPYSFSLHVRESKQYKEVRSYFDWPNLKGKYWEKKLKRGKMREKKIEWDIFPYSQNVVSAFFYLRNFQYRVGKKMMFRVADDGKNLVTTINVLKEEELKVGAGRFSTMKSEVNFEYEGVFKPVGSIFLWVTNEPQRRIARIDAKIKIGTIQLKLDKIERLP